MWTMSRFSSGEGVNSSYVVDEMRDWFFFRGGTDLVGCYSGLSGGVGETKAIGEGESRGGGRTGCDGRTRTGEGKGKRKGVMR
jgi:hypothetical protein